MILSAPIQPPDEPCSEVAINPRNAMLSLRSLTRVLPINGSLRNLSSTVGLNMPVSLREALLQGTWRAIQPEAIELPPLIIVGPEGRLNLYLRTFAQGKDPRKTLIQAAIECSLGNTVIATALADLAVTGRTSYEAFAKAPLTETILISDVKASFANLDLPLPSDAQIMLALTTVLDRAFKVAFALRGPYPERAVLRRSLGWIAVSGEDDPPHRPVNTVSAPYPQYEIPVVVGSVTVQTRFFIASPPLPANAMTTSFPTPGRSLPYEATPLVPDGDRVILFIHGHSSRAEEALELIPWLHQAGLAHGVRFSVISLDLPNNGYSSMFDHTVVAPSSATTFPGGILDHGPINTPILNFIENFIVSFVEELDHFSPIKHQFAGVIGGSLGGNMGLQLGRRDLTVYPWLASGIVSWDPASVWTAMVHDEAKRHAPEHCRDKWDENENEAFSRVNYFAEVFDNKIFEPNGKRTTNPFLMVGELLPAQPTMWYRNEPEWQPCKNNHIKATHTERYEIYNQWFRRWHWRVAGEQLIYSHVDHVNHEDSHSPYRYELNRVRQLLAAGAKDKYPPAANIYDDTRMLAQKMVDTPGRSLFLLNTGHSLHAERPRYLAGQIVNFLVENV